MMKKMRPSEILLIVGLVILLIGAILSVMKVEPYSNYVLIAGALCVFCRGAFRSRERDDNQE